MPKESVLSIADKEAIKIEKLIFHIILTDDVNPTFLEEVEITKEKSYGSLEHHCHELNLITKGIKNVEKFTVMNEMFKCLVRPFSICS